MLYCDAGNGRPFANHEHRRTADGAKPVERLKEIPFDSSRMDRTTRLGTFANPAIRSALITFLKENQEVFG